MTMTNFQQMHNARLAVMNVNDRQSPLTQLPTPTWRPALETFVDEGQSPALWKERSNGETELGTRRRGAESPTLRR